MQVGLRGLVRLMVYGAQVKVGLQHPEGGLYLADGIVDGPLGMLVLPG